MAASVAKKGAKDEGRGEKEEGRREKMKDEG
jgi:hypothetical protein